MASTITRQVTDWNNYHLNGPFPSKQILDIDTDRTIVSHIGRFNDAAQEIQSLLKGCMNNNQRFRAFGSRWSMSNIAHQGDNMLFISRLNIKIEIAASQMHPLSSFKAENLFLFQCGITVKEISEYLLKKGKSLKTCGASNGQTISGAISTGVHGSAIDTGSVQDGVVGIQLITGPNPNNIVYIERESRPALQDGFVQQIHSKVIRNDRLFNAALVSLGAFGVIHGIVMEAEDIYLLKRYVRKITRTDALQIAKTMDFAHSPFRIAEEMQPDGTPGRPYHYKLYINPFNDQEDFVTEIIYRKPYRTDYPNPIPFIKKSIFKDIPTWVASFAAKHRRLIPKILTALKSEAFPKVDDDIEGTLGEIFWDTSQSSAAFGCAFGIDLSDTTRALELFIQVMIKKGPIPGILSMRFVKGSSATLAFTKFPVTCILEVDGIPWKGNDNMITLDDFLMAVINVFNDHQIKFTLHWGKNAPWSFPLLIEKMYGPAYQEWRVMRSVLLSQQAADLFSNDFLDTAGLSDYLEDIPEQFIALRESIAAEEV